MAITLIAGIASMAGAAIAGTAWSWAAFALGAGLSLVSRALAPKLNMGSQMGGRSVTSREAAHSRKIVYGRARIGGNIVYLESTGNDNKYLWLVVAVAGHEIDAFESVWFNDKKILDGTTYQSGWASSGNSSTSPYVQISQYKGDQTAADSALVSASSKWTTNHKLLDTAYMVIKLTYDVDQFAQGLPNISTIIRGKKVLNPSDNSTAWSDNPALCAYDYLRDTKYGLGETAANILTASVTTAKGVCDETVSLAAGGTQKRYTINGVVDTANSIKSNIEQMLGSMIGRLVYSGGQFEIHAGAYVAPAFTVDESVAVGEITVQTKTSRRNGYNGVKGVFLSEDDNYILADYPAQISSSYATADGDPIYLDMALPFTTNNIRAQRIAKLALFRSRQQEAITIPCNLSALRFKVGENINVTNARLGYSNKIFEVVGYSMDFASDGQIVVNVDAIETASSIWAWATSDEEVFLGGGEVALYDGTVAAAPTSINVTSDSFLSNDGTFNSQFKVSWTNAADAFTDHYIVEWKLASDDDYFSQTTKSTPFHIVNLVNLASYNVRVKAVNEIGVSSAYLSATETSAVDATAPNFPTSVSATGEFEQITIHWTNPTVDDFKHVNIYRGDSAGATPALIDTSSGTSFIDTGLVLVNGNPVQKFYKLKSVDNTGNLSTNGSDNGFSAQVNATTTLVPVGGIADDAVDTEQIADLAVETDQLDNDAVTIAKIATSLQSTNYSSGSAGWKILKSGVVEFEQATIRGEITASTGVIGGFTVGSTSLIGGADSTRVSLSTADGISLGHNTFGSAPFRVTRAGALTATSATITGALTLTNVDGATVVYTGGNLQVGTIGGGNLGASAKFASFFRHTITSGTSVAAPSDSAFTSEFGRAPQEHDQLIVNNTATTPDTQAAYVRGSSAWGSAVDNFLSGSLIVDGSIGADQIIANTITAAQIQSNSITVNKLTGDVTEVYPLMLYLNTVLSTTETVIALWSLPAPALSISKRQKLAFSAKIHLKNTNNSTPATNIISFDIQKKSKGVNAQSVGTVTLVSFSNYQGLISVPGNQLHIVDGVGGIGDSATPSSSNNVLGVYYDATANKTYINYGANPNPFATNDTCYYSDSKFTSAGTWVTPSDGFTYAALVPEGSGSTRDINIPIELFFGSTTTATDFRIQAEMLSNIVSGEVFTVRYVRGVMENIA
jgi:hypothetical protein